MPRCPACASDEVAEEWGCRKPKDEPAFYIPCLWCNERGDGCTHCDGEGKVGRYRCPNVYVTQRELDVLSAVALVETGVLPDEGGWSDQAATFVRAHPIVANAIADERVAAQDRAYEKAKRNQR